MFGLGNGGLLLESCLGYSMEQRLEGGAWQAGNQTGVIHSLRLSTKYLLLVIIPVIIKALTNCMGHEREGKDASGVVKEVWWGTGTLQGQSSRKSPSSLAWVIGFMVRPYRDCKHGDRRKASFQGGMRNPAGVG